MCVRMPLTAPEWFTPESTPALKGDVSTPLKLRHGHGPVDVAFD